jgi:hypothetical protein
VRKQIYNRRNTYVFWPAKGENKQAISHLEHAFTLRSKVLAPEYSKMVENFHNPSSIYTSNSNKATAIECLRKTEP